MLMGNLRLARVGQHEVRPPSVAVGRRRGHRSARSYSRRGPLGGRLRALLTQRLSGPLARGLPQIFGRAQEIIDELVLDQRLRTHAGSEPCFGQHLRGVGGGELPEHRAEGTAFLLTTHRSSVVATPTLARLTRATATAERVAPPPAPAAQ